MYVHVTFLGRSDLCSYTRKITILGFCPYLNEAVFIALTEWKKCSCKHTSRKNSRCKYSLDSRAATRGRSEKTKQLLMQVKPLTNQCMWKEHASTCFGCTIKIGSRKHSASSGIGVTLLVYPSCPSWAKTIFHAVSTRVGLLHSRKSSSQSLKRHRREMQERGGGEQKNKRL